MPKTLEETMCEDATGCLGAGDFRKWAEQNGFPHCAVLNWTSSAGDWSFLVSADGQTWHPMYQSNNWPRPGFTRIVETETAFFGTEEEALAEACDMFA